ncbi:MAG: hypothetical protein JWM57_1634 [Phycisphaerales bacterium]|nr:hypothetical protein [Phycisphaerales bacterium]
MDVGASLISPDLSSAAVSAAESRPGVTWRSVLLGTLAVILVCGLTPLNDFVLTDSSLCAGFLPLIAIVIEFLLIVVFNSFLHRFAGRHALGSRELAVIGMMTLAACSIPNWGLMRFFIPTPIAGAFLGSSDPGLWTTIQSMKLPAWLFPTPLGNGPYPSDPVVSWFYNRAPPGEAIPWSSWIKPLAAWGVFAVGMIATLICIGRLVLDQWLVNERLPFPLVQLHSALIEAPRPGFALNETLRSPLMWIGLGTVFVIHSLNGLNAYFGPVVPTVPIGYNFTGLFPDPPLSAIRPDIQKAGLSFMVIGATYFIRSRVALSLWGIYILVALSEVVKVASGGEASSATWGDAHIGACAAFILGMLWVGRSHWKRILLNAVGRGDSNAYRLTFWVAILGIVTMLTWLILAGVQLWLCGLVVLFIVSAHLVVSRVVAETGLPYFRSSISTAQIYTNFSTDNLTTRSVFFASAFNVLGVISTRDSAMTFTQTGGGVAIQNGVGPRERRSVGALILWTFVLGCIVAGAATIYCHYTYPTPLSREVIPSRNNFGSYYIPKRDVYDGLNNFAAGKFPGKPHNPWAWMGIGFAITGVLEFGAKRFGAWPLLPVGFVASYGAFIGNAWFSIFIGWAVKSLVVKFGGAQLFVRTKPIFVGLILGEALAAAAFLLLNAILVAKGYPSHNVSFLL